MLNGDKITKVNPAKRPITTPSPRRAVNLLLNLNFISLHHNPRNITMIGVISNILVTLNDTAIPSVTPIHTEVFHDCCVYRFQQLSNTKPLKRTIKGSGL